MQQANEVGVARRRWLLGSVALAAAGSGAWLAWNQSPRMASNDEAVQAFWGLQLQQPDGCSVAVAQWRGQPLVVKFWATWCPPCVRELPLINRFAKAQAGQGQSGIQVLGIAVDQAAAVHKWLARQPLDFPVVLAGAGGVGLTRTLGNINGGLPFTILFDRRGQPMQRKIGELSEQDLAAWREKLG